MIKKPTKLNTNQPNSLQQNIREARRTKQSLPFKKMDDFSRRQFIQTFGTFLAVMSVPTVIRLETMSNISKKLFGSSTAFAAGAGSDPFKMLYYWRSGIEVGWFVGNNQFHTHPRDNKSWGNATITTHTTSSGPTLKLNPHAAMFAPDYVNSILFMGNVASFQNHGSHSDTTMRMGQFELCGGTAKTQFDAGLGSMVSQPVGFYDPLTIDIQNVSPTMAPFAPSQTFQISQLLNNFTAPTFQTGNGTNMSDTLVNNFLAVARGSFQEQFTRSLYQKDIAAMDASNEQALALLTQNYRNALDLSHPSNAAANTALRANMPPVPNVSGNSLLINTISQDNQQVLDPPAAVFALVMGYSLGVLPGTAAINRHGSDPHGSLDQPANANDPGGNSTFDTRQAHGQYIARELFNIFEWINNAGITNPAGGQLVFDCTMGGEFGRGLYNDTSTENLDGGRDPIVMMTSEKNQTRFKAGSTGGYDAASGQMMGFNAGNNSHSTSAAIYTTDQAFAIKCEFFGVDPADFGITALPVPTGLFS